VSKSGKTLWQKLIDAGVLLFEVEVKDNKEQDILVILKAERGNGLYLVKEHHEIIERIAKPELDKRFGTYKLEIFCVGSPF
jgi:hypothetical protein